MAAHSFFKRIWQNFGPTKHSLTLWEEAIGFTGEQQFIYLLNHLYSSTILQRVCVYYNSQLILFDSRLAKYSGFDSNYK